MDKILNSKSKLLKKYRSNLFSILLLAFLIFYINGESDTFIVGVMFILLHFCIIITIADIVLSYFAE